MPTVLSRSLTWLHPTMIVFFTLRRQYPSGAITFFKSSNNPFFAANYRVSFASTVAALKNSFIIWSSSTSFSAGWGIVSPVQQVMEFRRQSWLWCWQQWWSCSALFFSSPRILLYHHLCLVLVRSPSLSCSCHLVGLLYPSSLKREFIESIWMVQDSIDDCNSCTFNNINCDYNALFSC